MSPEQERKVMDLITEHNQACIEMHIFCNKVLNDLRQIDDDGSTESLIHDAILEMSKDPNSASTRIIGHIATIGMNYITTMRSIRIIGHEVGDPIHEQCPLLVSYDFPRNKR